MKRNQLPPAQLRSMSPSEARLTALKNKSTVRAIKEPYFNRIENATRPTVYFIKPSKQAQA